MSETNARELRDRQGLARKPVAVGSGSLVAEARQGALLLNSYAAGLGSVGHPPSRPDQAVLADFDRLCSES